MKSGYRKWWGQKDEGFGNWANQMNQGEGEKHANFLHQLHFPHQFPDHFPPRHLRFIPLLLQLYRPDHSPDRIDQIRWQYVGQCEGANFGIDAEIILL